MASSLVQKVLDAPAEAERATAADELASFVKSNGVGCLSDGSCATMQAAMEDSNKKKAGARAGALACFKVICEAIGQPADPYTTPLLPSVLKLYADKDKKVADEAKAAGPAFVQNIPGYAVQVVVPKLLEAMDSSNRSQTVVGALELLQGVAERNPEQTARCLTLIVPVVSSCMVDITDSVKTQARSTMDKCCVAIDNRDIKHLIPAVINAVCVIAEVPETIHQLASTTFVQTVEGPVLAITVPLLSRGLKEKTTSIKRQCAKIVANMSRLVEAPAEAAPFLPQLLPALDKAQNEVSDPEARAVCTQAYEQLQRIENLVKTDKSKKAEVGTVSALVKAKMGGDIDAHAQISVDFLSGVICSMCDNNQFNIGAWNKNITPYLSSFRKTDQVETTIKAVLDQCVIDLAPEEEAEEEEDAEELCNCKFTLAYGAKILLHNTELKLKRGFRYGLLGGNDSGKTTLMRSIAMGQVEGFPPPTEVRTVFVEADILGELSDLACIDYIYANEQIKSANIEPDQIGVMLKTVGFSDKMIGEPVTFLSGGWRMKLALARAMLQKADILLMDEPTNHLDVINVQWTMDYINSLKSVTSIIVSHDSKLLDNCCTHILEIKDLKLSLSKGNLSEFVAKHPEAKAYFELKSSKLTFNFPQPGYIEGIKSKGKALMKMSNVEYTYPVNTSPTITGITIQVSLSSRVACVGVNGAGKSTMIKLLTGEIAPIIGTVWKHPNARVAYVAQHAFHHIEQHLNKTPNEYIRWRYEHGDDRESSQKVTVQLTEEEEKKVKSPLPSTALTLKVTPSKSSVL